jgi:hypothetical protein
MKRLPQNSCTVIFTFKTAEDRDKFIEDEGFKNSYGSLTSVATKFNVKKVEYLPNP